MKTLLVIVGLILTTNAFADTTDPTLQLYLEQGRRSCGLNFQSLSPNSVSSSKNFPNVPVAPPPGVSSVIVGPSDFYQQGATECGQAASSLVRNPTSSFACVLSSGPYQAQIYGSGNGTDEKAAAAAAVSTCVKATGYLDTCFGYSGEQSVTCFSRN